MHASARSSPITKLDQIALAKLQTVMAEVSAAYDNFEFHKGVGIINKWVNTDLSAFYLEAMKDRLYCGDGGGVLEPIFSGLLRMLAPVTPNLVEEAWDHRLEWMKENPGNYAYPFHSNIADSLLPQGLSIPDEILADTQWLLNANAAIKAAQEEGRASKTIGSSLESSVILELPSEAEVVFERYADELATIFVVSSVQFGAGVEEAWKYSATFDAPGGKGVAWVSPPKDKKCPRCWRFVAPVEDELCGRCEGVVGV